MRRLVTVLVPLIVAGALSVSAAQAQETGTDGARLYIAALIAWVVLDYSAQRRILDDLEERGVTRRSQRSGP